MGESSNEAKLGKSGRKAVPAGTPDSFGSGALAGGSGRDGRGEPDPAPSDLERERAPKLPVWHEFLEGGPEHWLCAASFKIGTEIHHIMNHALESADPTSNMNVEYLMWRQSLDPPRLIITTLGSAGRWSRC